MDIKQLGLIVFNIMTPAIPEQVFYIFFSLFLMNKTEYLRITPVNVRKMLVTGAVVAAVAVPLRVYLPSLADSGLMIPVGLIITWTTFLFTYRVTVISEILKAFACITISFIINLLFQMAYIPLLMYGTDTNLEAVTQLGITSFIWSMPEVVMIFSVMSIITVKRNFGVNVNFMRILTRNRVVMSITISLLVFNVVFLAVMSKLIGFDKILFQLSFFNQLLVIAMVVIFPIINISMLVITVYSNYYRETMRVMLSKERISTLVKILGVYAEEKDYEKLDNIVNDLQKQVYYI